MPPSEQGIMRKCANEGRRRPAMSLSISVFYILNFGCGFQQVTRPLLLGSVLTCISRVGDGDVSMSKEMLVINRGYSSDFVFYKWYASVSVECLNGYVPRSCEQLS